MRQLDSQCMHLLVGDAELSFQVQPCSKAAKAKNFQQIGFNLKWKLTLKKDSCLPVRFGLPCDAQIPPRLY